MTACDFMSVKVQTETGLCPVRVYGCNLYILFLLHQNVIETANDDFIIHTNTNDTNEKHENTLHVNGTITENEIKPEMH